MFFLLQTSTTAPLKAICVTGSLLSKDAEVSCCQGLSSAHGEEAPEMRKSLHDVCGLQQTALLYKDWHLCPSQRTPHAEARMLGLVHWAAFCCCGDLWWDLNRIPSCSISTTKQWPGVGPQCPWMGTSRQVSMKPLEIEFLG